MEYLTQKELKEMLIFSAKIIDEKKEEINKINVFPVPDQDTGTNLAKTLLGIKEILEKKEFKNLEEFSQNVLDGALTSAQGNAGVIYTGFLAGFLPVLNKEPISAKILAEAFESGRKRAWESMLDPKEGTILDVIDATAKTFKKETEREKNIIKIFEKAIEKAKEALLATREKMEIFKKANVVDAGGLGFLMILESYLEALNPDAFLPEIKKEKPSDEVKKFVQVLANRYEAVALIFNPKFQEEKVKEKLKKLGNCLDVVHISDKMKIHIHTDYPEEVRDVIKTFGEIKNLRIEDMLKEVRKEPSLRKVSIGIVTENISTLPEKILEKYQIEQTSPPLKWTEISISPRKKNGEKLKKIEKEGIKVSPKIIEAAVEAYLDSFKKQLKKFEKVLCLTISSNLFGCYDFAIRAKELLLSKERNKVFIFDTKHAAASQALLVLKAIELIQEQREIEEIVKKLKEFVRKTRLYLIFENPKFLEILGIISRTQTNWIKRIKKIGIHPLMKIKDGSLEKGGIVFAQDSVEAIFKKIAIDTKKERTKGKKIRTVINCGNNPQKAEKLKKMLKDLEIEVSFISPGPEFFSTLESDYLIAGWQPIE